MTILFPGKKTQTNSFVTFLYSAKLFGICKRLLQEKNMSKLLRKLFLITKIWVSVICHSISVNKTAEWAAKGWGRRRRGVRLAVCVMGKFFK